MGTVSVKGILFEGGGVWLRRNERNEWELPGGKLDKGEQPEETVARELREELGFETEPTGIIKSHLYSIYQGGDHLGDVVVIVYLCELLDRVGDLEADGEAGRAAFRAVPIADIGGLEMPQFYKDAIMVALEGGKGLAG